MGIFFSRDPPKNQITDYDRAVLDLKAQRDQLRRYTKKLNSIIESEDKYARQCLREMHSLPDSSSKEVKRDGARRALRRKRYQQKLLEQAGSTLDNVTEMIDSMEFTEMNTRVLDVLRLGNQALGDLQARVGGADGVESVLTETEELVERQNEIDAILAGGNALSVDDDESVLAELEMLQDEGDGVETALEQAPAAPTRVVPARDSERARVRQLA